MPATVSKSPWWRHFEDLNEPEIIFENTHCLTYLDRAAETFPQRKAIIFQNYSLTYGELRKQAEQFAAALRLRGVENGHRIAIMLPNIPQTVIAVWGVLKAGAVAVMTNPLYMEKELTHHFHDSGARVLITMDVLWPKIAALYDKLDLRLSIVTRVADGLAFPLNYLQPWKAKRSGQTVEVPFNGQSIVDWKSFVSTRERFATHIEDPKGTLAFLQYTGGTTGVSKAAMLTHANMAAQMQILRYIVDQAPVRDFQFTFLGILPFFHIFGLAGNLILPAVFAGATIPVPRYTPIDLLRTIDKYQPNFFIGVPSVYISLMQQKDLPKYDLSCIDLCISGAAPFPVEALTRFQKLTGARITEGLGLTEASPCITANPIYGKQKFGSVGVPLPGTEVRIVDSEDGIRELGPHEHGELIVRGPQVMQGYWNKAEENAITLRDGWLYTGDIGYYDEDGYFFLADRKKDMIIVGGYNVYPREIDEVLHEHPEVVEAVAVGIPHRSRGEVLKAFVVLKKDSTVSTAELMAHCREKMANYKVPKFIEFCEELPKSLAGKILRRVLREAEIDKMKAAGHFKDSQEPLEDYVDEALAAQKKQTKDKASQIRAQAEEIMAETKKRAEEIMAEAKKKTEDMLAEAKKKSEAMLEQLEQARQSFKEKSENKKDEKE